MGKTLKKYLLFDLDTTALKEEFGPKRYTVVYSMIRQFLENCGFEHKQGSGYLSTEPISLSKQSRYLPSHDRRNAAGFDSPRQWTSETSDDFTETVVKPWFIYGDIRR